MQSKDSTYDKSIAHIVRLIIRKYLIVPSCRFYCFTPSLSGLDIHSDASVRHCELLHNFSDRLRLNVQMFIFEHLVVACRVERSDLVASRDGSTATPYRTPQLFHI